MKFIITIGSNFYIDEIDVDLDSMKSIYDLKMFVLQKIGIDTTDINFDKTKFPLIVNGKVCEDFYSPSHYSINLKTVIYLYIKGDSGFRLQTMERSKSIMVLSKQHEIEKPKTTDDNTEAKQSQIITQEDQPPIKSPDLGFHLAPVHSNINENATRNFQRIYRQSMIPVERLRIMDHCLNKEEMKVKGGVRMQKRYEEYEKFHGSNEEKYKNHRSNHQTVVPQQLSQPSCKELPTINQMQLSLSMPNIYKLVRKRCSPASPLVQFEHNDGNNDQNEKQDESKE